MSAFRQKPSHRKERRPQASWLVLGLKRAPAVARGDITMHAIPARGSDHRKRYAPGQRLAVKQLVGVPGLGDTLCHVHVLTVQGPADQMTAGQIGFHEARLLGHRTTTDFRLQWIREHDIDWWQRVRDRLDGREPDEATLDEFEERFERRWAGKLIWAITFTVDIAEPARLLAARSEELYTHSVTRALQDEFPALSETDYERHVAKRREMTTADWVKQGEQARAKERETKSVEERLQRIERDARARSVDITSQMWLIRKRLPTVSATSLEKQIEAIEVRVYRIAA